MSAFFALAYCILCPLMALSAINLQLAVSYSQSAKLVLTKQTALCRVYYVLQTIVPPIILVLSAFAAFLVAKDKFVDRLKTLVGLMFSLYHLPVRTDSHSSGHFHTAGAQLFGVCFADHSAALDPGGGDLLLDRLAGRSV